MNSYIFKGLLFLWDAYHIATQEAPNAIDRRQWNLAARRAYESMEKTVKAVHLLMGEEPPKTHSPGMPRDFDNRVPLVTWYAWQDPHDSVTYIVTKELSPFSLRVFKCVNGVLTLLATARLGSPTPVQLLVDGSNLYVIANGRRITAVTDTGAASFTGGYWVQLEITEERLRQIKNAMRKVDKGRDDAFYYEVDVDSGTALEVTHTASSIFNSVKRHVGHNLTVSSHIGLTNH